MPFTRPTLSELKTRIQTDVKSRLEITALLRRSVTGVLSTALAGAVHSLFGFVEFVFNNIFWDTAETTYLERWASIFDISRNAAAFATGNVTFSGTNGTVVPAGTLIQTSDGVQYSTDADGTVSGGSVDVAVTASEAGEDGNLDAAESLSFVSPVAGIDTIVVASGGLTGGTDTESDSDLRARFLERVQLPPTGGSLNDYIYWAKLTSGVTRAWVYPNTPATNEVTVLFVRDNDGTGIGADILPSAGEISTVQTVLDANVPITSTVTANAPTQTTYDIDITLTPNTTAVQNAVLAELADLILREAEPNGAANAANNGTLLLSHVQEAVSRAAGETDHEITAIQSTTPADQTPSNGEMFILGTVNFS